MPAETLLIGQPQKYVGRAASALLSPSGRLVRSIVFTVRVTRLSCAVCSATPANVHSVCRRHCVYQNVDRASDGSPLSALQASPGPAALTRTAVYRSPGRRRLIWFHNDDDVEILRFWNESKTLSALKDWRRRRLIWRRRQGKCAEWTTCPESFYTWNDSELATSRVRRSKHTSPSRLYNLADNVADPVTWFIDRITNGCRAVNVHWERSFTQQWVL